MGTGAFFSLISSCLQLSDFNSISESMIVTVDKSKKDKVEQDFRSV